MPYWKFDPYPGPLKAPNPAPRPDDLAVLRLQQEEVRLEIEEFRKKTATRPNDITTSIYAPPTLPISPTVPNVPILVFNLAPRVDLQEVEALFLNLEVNVLGCRMRLQATGLQIAIVEIGGEQVEGDLEKVARLDGKLVHDVPIIVRRGQEGKLTWAEIVGGNHRRIVPSSGDVNSTQVSTSTPIDATSTSTSTSIPTSSPTTSDQSIQPSPDTSITRSLSLSIPTAPCFVAPHPSRPTSIRVFVGNLPLLGDLELSRHLHEIASIVDVAIFSVAFRQHEALGKVYSKFAFLSVRTMEEAKTLIAECDGKDLLGSKLRADLEMPGFSSLKRSGGIGRRVEGRWPMERGIGFLGRTRSIATTGESWKRKEVREEEAHEDHDDEENFSRKRRRSEPTAQPNESSRCKGSSSFPSPFPPIRLGSRSFHEIDLYNVAISSSSPFRSTTCPTCLPIIDMPNPHPSRPTKRNFALPFTKLTQPLFTPPTPDFSRTIFFDVLFGYIKPSEARLLLDNGKACFEDEELQIGFEKWLEFQAEENPAGLVGDIVGGLKWFNDRNRGFVELASGEEEIEGREKV